MTKLYSPPTWQHIGVMQSALRVAIDVSTATYKKAGVWKNTRVLQVGEADGADYLFTTPTVITDALATEMQTAGVPGTYV